MKGTWPTTCQNCDPSSMLRDKDMPFLLLDYQAYIPILSIEGFIT